jgi:hypothetical protein
MRLCSIFEDEMTGRIIAPPEFIYNRDPLSIANDIMVVRTAPRGEDGAAW